jgi:hypothetical protein
MAFQVAAEAHEKAAILDLPHVAGFPLFTS